MKPKLYTACLIKKEEVIYCMWPARVSHIVCVCLCVCVAYLRARGLFAASLKGPIHSDAVLLKHCKVGF